MTTGNIQEIPVNVVGSSKFGVYQKISDEKTYNMYVSDDWLVNYVGFEKKEELVSGGEGRGFYRSERGNYAIAVISSAVYRIESTFSSTLIGNIETTTGYVAIAENLSSQIALADGQSVWIYNELSGVLTKQELEFDGNPIIPNYVSYQNTFFLIASNTNSINSQNWYVYEKDVLDNDQISFVAQLSIQTKSDSAIAVLPIPGSGNNVIVFGNSVAEIWTQVETVQTYRRIQSFNIDYGCVEVSTIASSDQFVCWLAQNENNAPTIMYTDGGSTKTISSDGIDNLLQGIKRPDKSTAFFFRQNGHLFYQLTFYDKQDNVTLFYDFKTQMFFNASDEKLNYFPARKVIFFQKAIYFISLNDGNIYQMGTQFITYKYSTDDNDLGDVVPRIRICKTIRRENSMPFKSKKFVFWLDQGTDESYLSPIDPLHPCVGYILSEEGNYLITEDGNYIITQDAVCGSSIDVPRVDMAISINGNHSFGSFVKYELNQLGKYKNIVKYYIRGRSNEMTIQLRFSGRQPIVANNGILTVEV